MAQTSRDCDGNDASHLATPPMRDSTREPRENHLERSRFHIPVNEACAAWERSLRPGQYFSEKGDHRPMHHRTQAVQGHHPGARTWPRGADGGAWGPQHLSPIPSERSYAPLVPSPTTSPGRRSRTRFQEGFFPGERSSMAAVDVVAVELGLEENELEALRSFEPIQLKEDALPPPLPPPPIETPWRAPPPGFDLRTLRRQASNLRGEAAVTFRDESSVRESSLRLAETLTVTVENGRDNSAAAREKLGRLYALLRRLRGERRRQGDAARAAVAWQESLEELRSKWTSCEDRKCRAEQARRDVQRALDAAIDSNRTAEAEAVRLEDALDEAWRRDEVAAEIERQTRNEEIADAFHHRRGRRRSSSSNHRTTTSIRGRGGSSGAASHDEPKTLPGSRRNSTTIDDTHETLIEEPRVSPLLLQTLSWGFHALLEACRRSKGMRRIAAARSARAEEEDRRLLREALTAWAIAVVLERGERVASARRTEEAVRLCFARWQLFAALETRFRAERKRRVCLRVMGAWREAVREHRRDLDLEQRREALVLRRCFRAWRILRANSTLTQQEYLVRRRIADKHRLWGLFGAWHLASLASASSSAAIVQGFRRRRDAISLAGHFRAWASLARARCWVRRRRLRQGLGRLIMATGKQGRLHQFAPGQGRWHLSLQGEMAGVGQARKIAHFPVKALLIVRDWRLHWLRRRREELRGRRITDEASCVDSIAMAHHRRNALSNGIRSWCRATAMRRLERLLCFPGTGGDGGRGSGSSSGVGLWKVRTSLVTWRNSAIARRRARIVGKVAENSSRCWRLARGIRRWRRWASTIARRRRARKAYALRASFVALRQACATSRRQRSACCALRDILERKRLDALGYAMGRLSAGHSLLGVARARARPARRRREREALAAAWKCWVGGWLRRQSENIRVRELEEQRRAKRLQDLGEQLAEAQRATAMLSKEAAAAESELRNATLLVKEQEQALIASRTSLTEAAAASAEVKARLGPSADLKAKRCKWLHAGAGTAYGGGAVRSVVDGVDSPSSGGHPIKTDGSVGAKRLARQRAVARVLAAAAASRRTAEERAVSSEHAKAKVFGKLRGQAEADHATLEGARAVVRKYQKTLEEERTRIEKTEAERLRVRAATTRLLQRVDGLERRAEEEAAQGARGASSGESERAALALEVSTLEARTREMIVILDEREAEAAELRQALAAKEVERPLSFQRLPWPRPEQEPLDAAESEQCSIMTNGENRCFTEAESTPFRAGMVTPPTASMASGRPGTDGFRPAPSASEAPTMNKAKSDVQELKKSIALLQQKVASSRMGDI